MRERESTGVTDPDVLPVIDLRVPGPWRSPEELTERLALEGAGFRVEGDYFVGGKAGTRFQFGVSPHDDEIHELFAHDGRLSEEEARRRRLACPRGRPSARRRVLGWAYVSVTAGREEVFSVGMHCLGFRDAEVRVPNIPDGPDRQDIGFLLHNFLGYLSQSGVPVLDGDPIGDEETTLFRARARPCTRFPPGTPYHNPYGVWFLESIDADD